MADSLSHSISGEIQTACLDEAVVDTIMMTAKEIEERYDIEFEQIGCDKDHVHIPLYGPSENCTGSDCEGV